MRKPPSLARFLLDERLPLLLCGYGLFLLLHCFIAPEPSPQLTTGGIALLAAYGLHRFFRPPRSLQQDLSPRAIDGSTQPTSKEEHK